MVNGWLIPVGTLVSPPSKGHQRGLAGNQRVCRVFRGPNRSFAVTSGRAAGAPVPDRRSPIGRNSVATERSMEFLGDTLDTRFLIGFAFIAALVLAGGLVWHRFGSGPLKAMAPRGRQPRLAVLEVAAVDHLRRLVLVRRDNTEHLLMIGGPTDVVVEPNIARTGASSVARELRPGPAAEIPARPSPLDDRPGWPPPIEPPLRVARPLDPLGEVERLDPPLRTPRETVSVEPAARMARTEPVVRAPPPPPISTERFPAEFDDESDEPILTMPPAPPEPPEPAMVSEPRRPQVQPPPPPAYEPSSFQPAPAAERRPTAVPPTPPPPPVAAPVEAPAFQRAPEPRRMVARPMPAPPPPPPPPPEPAESALEAAWMQASAAPPAARDLDQPAARQSPGLQPTVLTEARRAPAAPPKPTQNDESN